MIKGAARPSLLALTPPSPTSQAGEGVMQERCGDVSASGRGVKGQRPTPSPVWGRGRGCGPAAVAELSARPARRRPLAATRRGRHRWPPRRIGKAGSPPACAGNRSPRRSPSVAWPASRWPPRRHAHRAPWHAPRRTPASRPAPTGSGRPPRLARTARARPDNCAPPAAAPAASGSPGRAARRRRPVPAHPRRPVRWRVS